MYLDGCWSIRRLPAGSNPCWARSICAASPSWFSRHQPARHARCAQPSGFAYRWVTRFIALDKTEATKALTKLRRQWFNKRKSVTAMLREVMYNQPAS
jgi:type IV secretion system protein VirB4